MNGFSEIEWKNICEYINSICIIHKVYQITIPHSVYDNHKKQGLIIQYDDGKLTPLA